MDFTYKLPSWDQLPSVDLYLEQVLGYIRQSLRPICLNSTIITKNMIQNYVKKGFIDNPIKKKYKREAVAKLIVISLAKYVMEIGEIDKGINQLLDHKDMEKGYNAFVESLYSNFLDIEENIKRQEKYYFKEKTIDSDYISIEILCKTIAGKLLLKMMIEGGEEKWVK